MQKTYDRFFTVLKQEAYGGSYGQKEALGSCITEVRHKSGKITCSVQDLQDMRKYSLVFVSSNGSTAYYAVVGNFFTDERGKANFTAAFNPETIGDSLLTMDDINAIAVITPDKDSNPVMSGYIKEPVKLINLVISRKNPPEEPKEPEVQPVTVLGKPSVIPPQPQTMPEPPSETPKEPEQPVEVPFRPIPMPGLPQPVPSPEPPVEIPEQPQEPIELPVRARPDPDQPVEMPGEPPYTNPVEPPIPYDTGAVNKQQSSASERSYKHYKLESYPGTVVTKNKAQGQVKISEIFSEEDANNDSLFKHSFEGALPPPIHNASYAEDKTGETVKQAGQGKNRVEMFRELVNKFNNEMEELINLAKSPLPESISKADTAKSAGENNENIGYTEKLFRDYPPERPFNKQNKDVDWVRIGPNELDKLPIHEFNTEQKQFLSNSFESYGHFLFGRYVQMGEVNYILAVPDIYDLHKRIRIFDLGFRQFKPTGGEQLKNGVHGYWLMVD